MVVTTLSSSSSSPASPSTHATPPPFSGSAPLTSPQKVPQARPPPQPAANRASFHDFPFKTDRLPKLITTQLGWEHALPAQAATLPVLLQGYDVICQAQSGAGKTLAFAAPAVDLVETNVPVVQVLVIVPTRDLAEQHVEVLSSLALKDAEGEGEGSAALRVLKVTGGGRYAELNNLLLDDNTRPHIVVATMGSLLNFLEPMDRHGHRLDAVLHLQDLKMLVVDEVDSMMSETFEMEMRQLWRHVTPRTQVVCLSSSYTRETMRMCRQITNQARLKEVVVPDYHNPVHEYYSVVEDKMARLIDLAEAFTSQGQGRILVFFSLKATKDRVLKYVHEQAQWAEKHASGQPQLQSSLRFFQSFTHDVKSFRADKEAHRVLLAMDGAGRGLDLPDVGLVISYETAKYAVYRQRLARCGHVSACTSVVLVSPRQVNSGEGSIAELSRASQRPIVELGGDLSSIPGFSKQGGPSAPSSFSPRPYSKQHPSSSSSTTTTTDSTSPRAIPSPFGVLSFQADKELDLLDLMQEVKEASEDMKKLLRSLESSQGPPTLSSSNALAGEEGQDAEGGGAEEKAPSGGSPRKLKLSLTANKSQPQQHQKLTMSDQVEELARQLSEARRAQQCIGREYETTVRGRTIERCILEGVGAASMMLPDNTLSPGTTAAEKILFGPKEYLPSDMDAKRKEFFKALVRDVNSRGVWVRVGNDEGVFPFKDAKLSVRQGGDFDFRPGHVLLVQLLKVEGSDQEPKLSKLDALYVRHLEM